MVQSMSDNVQKGVQLLLQKPFNELAILLQIIQAYEIDKVGMEEKMVEILTENESNLK